MCGICGILKFNHSEPIQKEILDKMTDSLFHRGPDDRGIYIEGNLGLGIQRLSIIDIKGGHQPMHNEDSTIWLVFNGEIFNFQELRQDLIKIGHNFSTQTDTEVILHLYEQFDLGFVNKLNGMFAFALWDKNKKRLVLAVDRFGIKPLHYSLSDKELSFGSEIKAILQMNTIDKTIDYSALDQYFSYGYIPSDGTIFKSIKRLLPAQIMIYEQGRRRIEKYWDIEFKINKNTDIESIKIKLEELLRKSVKDRLISEVPLGIFLSGGMDSSIITALATQVSGKRIKTFSMGFDVDSYNELKYARVIAKCFNTDHHEFMVGDECIKAVPKIMDFIDEPFADSSAIPTYLICKLSKQYITVALAGEGGDELFGGYSWTAKQRTMEYFNHLPQSLRSVLYALLSKWPYDLNKHDLFSKLLRFISDARSSPLEGYLRRLTCFTGGLKTAVYSAGLKERIRQAGKIDIFQERFDYSKDSDWLDRMLDADFTIFLPHDCLTKVDRMSMANSLEVRPPILDNDFVEFALNIDNHLKIKGASTKYILKETFSQLLPSSILKQRKHGFSIPLHVWFRRGLKDYLWDILSSQGFAGRGFFNRDYVLDLAKKHASGKYNFASQLWELLVFENWASKHRINL